MIMIHDYELEPCGTSNLFYVRSREEGRCPCCREKMKVIGSRHRMVYRQDGTSISLVIRRLKCSSCRKIHHELPDLVVPYKRYEAAVIEEIIRMDRVRGSNQISDTEESHINMEETAQFCYPCESSTARRIRKWFCEVWKTDLLCLWSG